MVKVTGPLFSLDASCSIGKAITYMKRGPINFVRKITIPVQTWSENYTFQKYIHGGYSKVVAKIQRDWIYHDEILKLKFEKADFQAQVIGILKNNLFKTDDEMHDLWNSMILHPYKTDWFKYGKKVWSAEYFPPFWRKIYGFDYGFQLYVLAQLAVLIRKKTGNVFNFLPYTIEIADWTDGRILRHSAHVKDW